MIADGASPNSLEVMLTRECVLRCSACRVVKRPVSMSETTLRQAVDLLFTSEASDVRLLFFGGEPTLRLDLVEFGMKHARRLAAETGKRVRFSLSTSGLLLDRPTLKRLRGFEGEILFGLKGSPRPGRPRDKASGVQAETVARQVSALPLLLESGIDFFVEIVRSPAALGGLADDIECLAEMGVRRVQWIARLGVEWKPPQVEALLKEYDAALRRWPQGSSRSAVSVNNVRESTGPVMLTTDITVDCRGKLCAWIGNFLEKGFPRMRRALDLGHLRDASCLADVWMSDREIGRKIVLAYPQASRLGAILRNNLKLELGLRSFFSKYRSREARP